MEVITLNKKDFLKKFNELKHQINVEPDLVIGVLNGGRYLIDNLKSEKNYQSKLFKKIKLQRKGETLKEGLVFKCILRILPYKVLDKLRIYESKKAKEMLKRLDVVELSGEHFDFKLSTIQKELIKTILIVDDAIDTGRTMFVIKNNLGKIFPDANIRVAVIAWTIETSIVQPDYYLFKNVLVRYPWSKDYKGKDFEKKGFSS